LNKEKNNSQALVILLYRILQKKQPMQANNSNKKGILVAW
jgi:hypothetical protein